jgi:hypothetical protein
MTLNQQQIDELRAWQHEKAPGGELSIMALFSGSAYAELLKDGIAIEEYRNLSCHDYR